MSVSLDNHFSFRSSNNAIADYEEPNKWARCQKPKSLDQVGVTEPETNDHTHDAKNCSHAKDAA